MCRHASRAAALDLVERRQTRAAMSLYPFSLSWRFFPPNALLVQFNKFQRAGERLRDGRLPENGRERFLESAAQG